VTVELKSLDLVYEETKMQVDRQLANFRALDAKANVTAGVAGIVLGLVVTKGYPACYWDVLKTAAVLFLLMSVLCSLFAMWIVGWRSDPLPDGMRFYVREEPAIAKRQFLANMRDAYKVNLRKTNRKAWCVKAAMASLALALALVGIAVVAS
jgi:hypothetical protein